MTRCLVERHSIANTSLASSCNIVVKTAAESAGVLTLRPTTIGSPAASVLTVYRIVSSRSVMVSVCIGVSSVCAGCGSFAT